MNDHSGNDSPVVNSSRTSAAILISKTFWGYIINKGATARRRARLGELAAICGCFFFGAASFGQWLVPGSIYAGDILPIKISGTIMFFVFAAQLYLIARRGLSYEVQVDTKRQCVRMARRNLEGSTTITATHDFADIGSVYIKRSKSDFIADQMFMRIAATNASILIVSGPAKELEPLLDQIQRDFRGQMPTAPKTVPDFQKKMARPRARSAFAAS